MSFSIIYLNLLLSMHLFYLFLELNIQCFFSHLIIIAIFFWSIFIELPPLLWYLKFLDGLGWNLSRIALFLILFLCSLDCFEGLPKSRISFFWNYTFLRILPHNDCRCLVIFGHLLWYMFFNWMANLRSNYLTYFWHFTYIFIWLLIEFWFLFFH